MRTRDHLYSDSFLLLFFKRRRTVTAPRRTGLTGHRTTHVGPTVHHQHQQQHHHHQPPHADYSLVDGQQQQQQPPPGHPQGSDGLRTGGDPHSSSGGMPRSTSFQQAQMSPLQEFVFPDVAAAPHFRTQFQQQQQQQQQQAVMQQQIPALFVAPHYRHAQEAFAMQESMLL